MKRREEAGAGGARDGGQGRPWPVWKLALLLYPFAAGAVAINLFLIGLMTQAIGLRALSPLESTIGGIVLGIPATWLAGRWVRGLIDEAEGRR